MAGEIELLIQGDDAIPHLDELVLEVTGESIYVPELSPLPAKDGAPIFRQRPEISIGRILPVGDNLDVLSRFVGRGMIRRDFYTKELRPGVVDPKSTTKYSEFKYSIPRPHFTDVVLTGFPDVQELTDTTESYKLSELQKVFLDGIFVLQDPKIGVVPEHDSESDPEKLAHEIGRVVVALRSLTDPSLHEKIISGNNPVHELSSSNGGLASHLNSRPKDKVPDMLEFKGSNSVRQTVSFRSEVVSPKSADFVFIESPAFDELNTTNTELASKSALRLLGLGYVAVKQKLGKKTDSKLKKVLDNLY